MRKTSISSDSVQLSGPSAIPNPLTGGKNALFSNTIEDSSGNILGDENGIVDDENKKDQFQIDHSMSAAQDAANILAQMIALSPPTPFSFSSPAFLLPSPGLTMPRHLQPPQQQHNSSDDNLVGLEMSPMNGVSNIITQESSRDSQQSNATPNKNSNSLNMQTNSSSFFPVFLYPSQSSTGDQLVNFNGLTPLFTQQQSPDSASQATVPYFIIGPHMPNLLNDLMPFPSSNNISESSDKNKKLNAKKRERDIDGISSSSNEKNGKQHEFIKNPNGSDDSSQDGEEIITATTKNKSIKKPSKNSEMQLSEFQQQQLETAKRFKGVTYHIQSNRFRARIKINNRTTHLGYFDTASKAASAYDRAAMQLRGQYALTNYKISAYSKSNALQPLPGSPRTMCIAAAKLAEHDNFSSDLEVISSKER